MSEIAHPAPDGWLKRFFLSLVILALLAGLLLVPWAVCWLTASGELDQEEVVARQAQGEFVLFGPGLAQDIMAYKLALYAAVKPEVVVLGSSRAGNVRAAFFERPFVNMAGAATDLESLRRTMPLPARCASWKAAAASGPGALRRTGNAWKPLPRSAAVCARAASAPSSSCRPWPRPYWAPLPTGTAVMPAGCRPCGRACWTAAWRAWIFRIPASTAPANAR